MSPYIENLNKLCKESHAALIEVICLLKGRQPDKYFIIVKNRIPDEEKVLQYMTFLQEDIDTYPLSTQRNAILN